MNKKLFSIILVLLLLIAVPLQVFADSSQMEAGLKYVNIGDSIAVGLSAQPGSSYFDLYSEYLQKEKFGLAGAVNLSAEGLDSMELLGLIKSDPVSRNIISQADVITISIGGNNLLTPVIGTVAGLYEVTPTGDFMGNLMMAIAGGGKEVWEQKLAAFTASALSSSQGSLVWMLEARTAQFLEDWPAILGEIESINPDAQIIAMTLYNPIEKEDNKVLYDLYERLVRPMNMAMMRTQNRAMLARVEKVFGKEPGAVAFKLTWTEEMPPVLIDPHPTTLGHRIIFEELAKVRNPRSFR